ncbi:hypothetical protein CA601_41695 [Paraburkholderia hospita]|nr:hypothetical protein CA601_41695 [Paraburkholderia hospita]
MERAYGTFLRTVQLPEDIDADKVDAKFDTWILTLRPLKTGGSKSPARRIEIR